MRGRARCLVRGPGARDQRRALRLLAVQDRRLQAKPDHGCPVLRPVRVPHHRARAPRRQGQVFPRRPHPRNPSRAWLRARLADPARRLMGTTPRCPGGGKRMAVSGEEGRWFALVGAFLPIVDEASPRCGGEASVLCSGSVLSRTLARVPSGGRSSLLAGVSEVCQLLFQ